MVTAFLFDKVERLSSGGLWKVAGVERSEGQIDVYSKPPKKHKDWG